MQLGCLRDSRGHYSCSSGVQPRRPKGIREAPLCSSFTETQGSSSSGRKILIHPGALAPLPKRKKSAPAQPSANPRKKNHSTEQIRATLLSNATAERLFCSLLCDQCA